jgi:prefoldin alpha subunit
VKQEEYLLGLQMLEQQANQFEEQLATIDQQIGELTILKNNVNSFEKSDQKDILSEFGRGIFIKAKVEKKEFLVDVGSKIMVKKSAKEIREIIDSQIKKFEEIKPQIAKRIEQINEELNKLIEKAKSEGSEDMEESEAGSNVTLKKTKKSK